MGGVSSVEELDAPITVAIGDKLEGSTQILRHPEYADRPLAALPYPDRPEINTTFHVFSDTASRIPENPCLGRRPIVDGVAGAYVFESYGEVAAQVRTIGSGLKHLGLEPGSPVGIFSINRPEWTKCLISLWSQALVCVPLYDTLGASAVEFIVNDANVSVIFTAGDKTARVLEVAPKCPSLRTIVQFDPISAEIATRASESNIAIMTLAELIQLGQSNPHEPTPPNPEALAYIMYTSGTTGNPKGVLLSHQNVLASAAGLHHFGVKICPSDVYLSYLPLAHSFETVMQVMGLIGGGCVGFFQGDVRKLTDDICALRPTVFAGVPRVYSRIYDKIKQTLAEGSWVKRMLFQQAYDAQAANLEAGRPRSAFWDSLIFSKTAQRLGGRIRLMATGAAPMPSHLHTFIQVVFMAPLMQGYGMTENAAAAVVTPFGYRIPGRIGAPLPCTEVKLVDIPEMEYLSTDKPFPRGEVCLRGPNVFQGYYKLDDQTKETLDADGWLHTGDVGRINEDGSISIIDRKKNIFKLAQGEYVAAEELEMIFGKASTVGQIFVYGDSFKTVLVAIVVPNVETIKPWCHVNNIEGNFAAMCENPRVKAKIVEDINAEARAAAVASFKIPKDIFLESEVNELGQGFSVENDCLTPTFKLRRPQLKKRYQAQIDAMYVGLGEGSTSAAK